MIHKEIVELWRKHQEVHEFAQAVEAIVRADEREACAKVCEDMGRGHGSAFAEFDCVAAIRARGEK